MKEAPGPTGSPELPGATRTRPAEMGPMVKGEKRVRTMLSYRCLIGGLRMRLPRIIRKGIRYGKSVTDSKNEGSISDGC